MVKNNNFNEPNSANVYTKSDMETYRWNCEIDIDLPPKVNHFSQPDVRIKTSIGSYRGHSPKFLSSKAWIVKPKSSAKLKRIIKNDKNVSMNKYYALIDQAFKMTAKYSSHAHESQKFLNTQTKFTTSEKQWTRSASERLRLRSSSQGSTVKKLKSQFKGRSKPFKKDAKDLIYKQNIRKISHNKKVSIKTN
jgi:hypothetical protein